MMCANDEVEGDNSNKSIPDELAIQVLQEFAVFQSFGHKNLFHLLYKYFFQSKADTVHL